MLNHLQNYEKYTATAFLVVQWCKTLCSPWNFAQCYVSAWMGGGLEGELIHICMALIPSCSLETVTTCFISYTPIQENQKI